jgi:hypothetical protein
MIFVAAILGAPVILLIVWDSKYIVTAYIEGPLAVIVEIMMHLHKRINTKVKALIHALNF